MFSNGEIIDGKYRVDGVCSDSGGMGAILFVTPVSGSRGERIVLKYCKNETEECLKRFKREIRLLWQYKDNSKVADVIDFNVDCSPPYFVMKYYESGDLLSLSRDYFQDFGNQEKVFNEIIDCVSELHANGHYHRDIKPQNFLLDGANVVVSDFGLGMELDSSTAFTRSSQYWGTPGYLPPEFQTGGFRQPDAAGDIFMIGKTFYALLTGRDPVYLVGDGIPSPIFHVIDRCCALDKARRYQTLAELKQSLTAAFDVLLHRTGGLGETRQLLTSILDRLGRENRYDSGEVGRFIEKLALLEAGDKIRVCFEIQPPLFDILKQAPLSPRLSTFLSVYQEMVESEDYGWSYAEIIASNMQKLFIEPTVPIALKAKALELSIDAAHRMNRFAAMDTCRNMITNIRDEQLGLAVSDVILRNPHTFISSIEPSECQAEAIRHAIKSLPQE